MRGREAIRELCGRRRGALRTVPPRRRKRAPRQLARPPDFPAVLRAVRSVQSNLGCLSREPAALSLDAVPRATTANLADCTAWMQERSSSARSPQPGKARPFQSTVAIVNPGAAVKIATGCCLSVPSSHR